MYSGEERQAKMNAMLEQMNDPDHKKAVAVADAAIERFTEADFDVSECSKLNDNNIPSERQLRKTQTAQAKQEFADAEAALKRLRGDFLAGTKPAQTTAKPAPGESVQERGIRLLQWFTEEERIAKRGALARVFEREKRQNPKADRSNIGKDIKKARGTATTQKIQNVWNSQRYQSGKRPG